MNEFENKLIKGIYASRYIASWFNVGGTMDRYYNKTDPSRRRVETYFSDWLRTLVINGEHLTEDEIRCIVFVAENGKFELEGSARDFLSKKS